MKINKKTKNKDEENMMNSDHNNCKINTFNELN